MRQNTDLAKTKIVGKLFGKIKNKGERTKISKERTKKMKSVHKKIGRAVTLMSHLKFYHQSILKDYII